MLLIKKIRGGCLWTYFLIGYLYRRNLRVVYYVCSICDSVYDDGASGGCFDSDGNDGACGGCCDSDCGHMQMLGFQLTDLMQKAAP